MRRRRKLFAYRRRRRGFFARVQREWEDFSLEPETKRGVFALLWFLGGVLAVLSLFGAAGRLGDWLRPRLLLGFGGGGYVLPFIVTVVALTRLDPDRFPLPRARLAGLLLAIVTGLGLLHLPTSPADALAVADAGAGGGLVGFFVTHWLRLGIGAAATVVALLVLFLAGLVLASNRTPGTLLRGIRARRIARARAIVEREARAVPLSPRAPEAEAPSADEEEEAGDGPAGAAPAPALPVFTTKVLDGVRLGDRSPVAGRRSTSEFYPYEPPPLTLLSDARARPVSQDNRATQTIIQRTLETFGIRVEMGEVSVGPTVTQYTLRPAEGVKLAKIVNLHNDLALALAAHPIRIEAPIPGKGLVGVEVPNKAVAIVRLREILASPAFQEASGPLVFALGQDVTGSPAVTDLERMPHLLIAGATGSGKSVLINCMLVSLLQRNSPATLKLLLVDPKRVELPFYNGIPHLLAPVIVEPEKTINALRWAVAEMDRRYELLSATRKRDITRYNERRRTADQLPRIVIVVDELADIMARHAREVENAAVRLAQIARAVGIHLVLATQRPSVDVLTGLIKANITARVAFKVASAVDARTILDSSGAEKLLGSGDMLFLASGHTKPRRLQGAYVSEEEVRRSVAFLARAGEVTYEPAVTEHVAGSPPGGDEEETEVDDALFAEARRVVIEARRASTSLLQRRLRIGYARAARIMDLLEEQGTIGPPDGARPREVLVPSEDPFAGGDVGTGAAADADRPDEEADAGSDEGRPSTR